MKLEEIVKLGATSQRARSWIKKVYELYPKTWQNNHVMTWGQGDDQELGIFELVPSFTKKDAVEVKWFQAYPLRRGVGSRAMRELQRLAQEDGISLTLYPWDKGSISQSRLMKFYKSLGFSPVAQGSKNLHWTPAPTIELEELDYDNEDEFSSLPSVQQGEQLRPLLIKAAQQVYDDWDEEDRDTYAGGGICHLIADVFSNILWDHKINSSTVSSSHEQHVYVVAQFREGVYSIDLHYSYYETGGGFTWQKIPNVVLDPGDIHFYKITSDPGEFEAITSEY